MRISRRSAAVAFANLVLALAISAVSLGQQTLTVKLVSLTSPARPGTDATIAVTTAPKAACTIAVIYKSGASRAQGLVPKTADDKGKVSWTWRVGTRTIAGAWPIIVNCTLGDRKGKLETSFNVT